MTKKKPHISPVKVALGSLPPVTPAPKSVTAALREELRVLSAAAEEAEEKQHEWFTPEFIAMVTSVIVNLITAAAVVGWVDSHSAQELTKSIAAVGAAVGALWANSIVLWKYLAGRQAVKTEAVKAKYHYMESVAVERMRSSSGW
jgi:hypothetical protein